MTGGVDANDPRRLPDVSLSVIPPQDAALDCYQQGDHLATLMSIPMLNSGGAVAGYAAPQGVIVITQTCDIVQTSHRGVAVAPLIHVPPAELDRARKGARPQWARVPQLGDDTFADLDVVGTVAKAEIARHARHPGLVGTKQTRQFGQALARKFSRFAFPDAVHAWLLPLQRLFTSKSGNAASPLGKMLDAVLELRIDALPDWHHDGPLQLTLHIIVRTGVLPTFAEDAMPELPSALEVWLYDQTTGHLRRKPSEIAQRLHSTADRTEKYWLWQMFGEATAELCHPSGPITADVEAAVESVTAEVVAVDEYTLDQARRTVELDLEFLSPPLPSAS